MKILFSKRLKDLKFKDILVPKQDDSRFEDFQKAQKANTEGG